MNTSWPSALHHAIHTAAASKKYYMKKITVLLHSPSTNSTRVCKPTSAQPSLPCSFIPELTAGLK